MIALGPTSITLVMYQNVCLYIWIKNSLNVYNMYYIHGKSEIIPENLHFCFTEYAKAFDCVNYIKLWRTLKVMGYQTTLLPPEKLVCQLRSNS